MVAFEMQYTSAVLSSKQDLIKFSYFECISMDLPWIQLTKLINFYNEMTSVINEGMVVDVIFLTFFNAFTHKILIEDLLKNEQTEEDQKLSECPETEDSGQCCNVKLETSNKQGTPRVSTVSSPIYHFH